MTGEKWVLLVVMIAQGVMPLVGLAEAYVRALWARLTWWWCGAYHRHGWPICGHCTCLECGRRHRVRWEDLA